MRTLPQALPISTLHRYSAVKASWTWWRRAWKTTMPRSHSIPRLKISRFLRPRSTH